MIRESVNGIQKIMIPNDFTAEEADDFRKEIHRLMDDGEKHFEFHFNKCSFIDSTGLGVLISVYKRCLESNGSCKLFSLQMNVMRIFKVTRMDQIFEIYP